MRWFDDLSLKEGFATLRVHNLTFRPNLQPASNT